MHIDFGTISTIATPILSGLLCWILGRRRSAAEVRKLNAEAATLEIKSAKDVVAFWQEMVDDLTIQMTHLKTELVGIRNENLQLKVEIKKLEELIQTNINK